MPRECKLCNDPKAQSIVAKVILGELDDYTAARMLGVSRQYLWHHIRNHVRRDERSPPADENIIRMLRSTLNDLHTIVQMVMRNPGEWRLVPNLLRELRGIAETLAKLEGKLNEQPVVIIQQYNIIFNRLQNFLMNELCDECRRKAIEFLENISQQLE